MDDFLGELWIRVFKSFESIWVAFLMKRSDLVWAELMFDFEWSEAKK